MKLVIDQDRARALGVTSQRIRQMLQAAMSGAPLDDFRDGEETVSIVAREPEASRTLLSAVDSVYYPDRFRRLRAAVAGRQGRSGAGAGHRMAAQPPADDLPCAARCRTACSRTMSR